MDRQSSLDEVFSRLQAFEERKKNANEESIDDTLSSTNLSPQFGGNPYAQGTNQGDPYGQAQNTGNFHQGGQHAGSAGYGGGYGQTYPNRGAPANIHPTVMQWFQSIDTDRCGRINAQKLSIGLTHAYKQGFEEPACKMMINLFDRDQTGTVDINEFSALLQYIHGWKQVFDSYDRDKSGFIEEEELGKAFSKMGFRFTPEFVKYACEKFGNQGKVNLNGFIYSCVQIRKLTDGFRARDTELQGVITIGFEDFISLAVTGTSL